MAVCDAALFLGGWEDARDCRMEHAACEEYGIRVENLTENSAR